MQDTASLDNLRDIAEPAPVSWWPLAPGWWAVITLAAVAITFYAYRAWQRWRANQYRRAALAELHTANTDADIAAILKRTALCAFPRIEVASLEGAAWCSWLSATSGISTPTIVSERLVAGVFRDDSTCTPELADFAIKWVAQHRVEAEGSHRSTN